MACDAGYLRGKPEEIEASKVLALLEELKTGELPLMSFGHGDCDEVHEIGASKILEEKVPELCRKLKTVDVSSYSGQMQKWWKEHQRADRKREHGDLSSNKATIAKQLNIKDFPFIIRDKNFKEVYYEDSAGFWEKSEYDSGGKQIYLEDSYGVIMDNRPSENIERIREFFRQVRLMTHHHLGLGAIKLTVEQQDEICYLVESLINKRID